VRTPDVIKRVQCLDGLRGVAVLLVICVHANHPFGGIFPPGPFDKTLAAVFGAGWIGVNIFFVLSGFLITGILLDSKTASSPVLNFYARRALRIFPLYFAFLLLVSLPAFIHFRIPFLVRLSPDDLLSVGGFYYNFRISFFSHASLVNIHHFWSLCVEEHFYLIWPFIVICLSAKRLVQVCLTGMILSLSARIAVLASGQWKLTAYYITPCELDGLLAGAFLACALRNPDLRKCVADGCGKITCLAAASLILLIMYQGHFYNEDGPGISGNLSLTIGISAVSLLFTGLIANMMLGRYRLVRSWLSTRLLVSLGKYSYGMYVFHMLVLNILHSLIQRYAAFVTASDWVAKPLLAITGIASSATLAMLSYYLFEVHFLRLKRYFSGSYQGEPEAVVRS